MGEPIMITVARKDLELILERSKIIDIIVGDLENKPVTEGFITHKVKIMLGEP